MLQLKLRAISRWTNDFFSLLTLCRSRQDMRALNSVLITHGMFYEPQPVTIQFMFQCCSLGFPDLALSAFETMKKPSLSLQNALIKSLCDSGLFENVLSVYRRCRGCGVPSDGYTYPFVIKACAVLNGVCFGKMTHCLVFRTGFVGNIVLQTSLVDFYSKIGDMSSARRVFDEIPQQDSVSWNALISGCCVNGLDQKALTTFCEMRADGVKPNAITLASVFPVCSRGGSCENGVLLHGLAHKLGYAEDSSLVPSLITIYANRGNLSSARIIFSDSTEVSPAIYNAMISSYTRNCSQENATAVFRLMLQDGLKPNMVTFLSLIPCSVHLGDIYLLGSFHGCVIKSRLEKEPSLVTSLLSAYAKLGDIESAYILFCSIQVRSLLLWNSMVSAYAKSGLWKESIDAFYAMQIDGVRPDAVSVISLLTSCSRLKAILPGKAAQGFSLKRGIDMNLNASNAFLAFYCNCEDSLVYAFRIFHRMDVRDVVSWNTMISACIDRGDSDTSMLLFHQMRQEGTNFDLVTLISILPSCHECNSLMLGLTIHGYAIKTDLKADTSLSNALISMYVNSGDLDAARFIFEDMPCKSIVSWNAILTGYRYHDMPNETLELFNRMIWEDHERPNYLTLATILPASRFLLQGKSVHAYSIRTRISLETTPLLTSLMVTYARHKDLKSCFVLFDTDNDKRNISTWNALLSACLLSENYTMAFSLFLELLESNLDPDDVTILNVITACLHLNNLKITDSVMAYLTKAGFERDMAVNNALIDLYAKCGNISDSRVIFDSLPQRDEISWSTMINAYGVHGQGKPAVALYSQMRIKGLKPDKVTYLSILSACSHSGLVEQGRTVLKDMMKEDGVLPSLEHYSCMVDLLGRTGHLNEAYEIVKSLLPLDKGCGNILESLLGACLCHGDYGLGEEIGRLVLEMNPKDSGMLVILHNLYTAAGKWRDANYVRFVMEQKQLSKASGVSVL